MENRKLIKLNRLINNSYECFSFAEFLKLTIFKLHELVMYDSGMFFCGISRDCSFLSHISEDGWRIITKSKASLTEGII